MGRIAGLDPEMTRERILDAAAEVFAGSGFDGARVAQIANVANLSVGAIYNHYPSKAELLAAVVEHRSAVDLEQLLASDEAGGVLELMAARGKALNGRRRSSDNLLAEMILVASRDPAAAAILVPKTTGKESLLADFVQLGQADGEVIDDIDPAVVARFCLMLGLGSLMVHALELPSTDPDSWGSFITRLVEGFRSAGSA